MVVQNPQVGEIWADRDGVCHGPLEASENPVYRLTFGKIEWTEHGAQDHLGMRRRRDLVQRVRLASGETDPELTSSPVAAGAHAITGVTVPDTAAPQLDALGATLAARKNTHGEYNDHARVTQEIKAVIRSGPSYDKCSPHERETLDMIAHKIGRIVSGDPHFTDHWHDIAGYARLSEERNK